MAKAEYNTNNIGHFGLASESYTHFTSPIRRYPDLMVHRLICNTLFGTDYQIEASLDEACKQSTENEQRAEQAERDIHKFKKNQISCKTYGRAFRSYHNVCGSFRFKYICRIHYAERYYTSGINPPRRYIPVQQKKAQMVKGRITGKSYRASDNIEVMVERIDIDYQEAYFYPAKELDT